VRREKALVDCGWKSGPGTGFAPPGSNRERRWRKRSRRSLRCRGSLRRLGEHV